MAANKGSRRQENEQGMSRLKQNLEGKIPESLQLITARQCGNKQLVGG